MGKFLFNFNFYKKPISFVFLAIFLVGIFSTIIIPKKIFAQASKDNPEKYNPAYLYYEISSRGAGYNNQPQISLQWEQPANIETYKSKNSDAKLNYSLSVDIWPSKTATCSKPSDNNKIPYQKTFQLSIEETSKIIYDKNFNWNNCVSVTLRVMDDSIKLRILNEIGYLETTFFSKTTEKNLSNITYSENCPPKNLSVKISSSQDYNNPDIYLSWEANSKNNCPKEVSNQYVTSGQVFKVIDPKNNSSTISATTFQQKAQIGVYKIETYLGKKFTNTQGGAPTISTEGDRIGLATINVDSLSASAANNTSGRIDAKEGEGGGVNTGPGKEDPTGDPTTPTFCKREGGFTDLWGHAEYIICRGGESLINLSEDALSYLINTFKKVGNISSDNSGEDSYLLEQIKEDNIKEAWNYVITIVDALIVMILLVASFANILRVQLDTYAVKKLLPGLITGIIAAHFSYFVIYILLDINAIISTQAISWAGGIDEISNTISSGLTGFGAIKGIAFLNFIVLLFMLVPIILCFLLVLLMIARIFMILILTMFSPIALIAMGVPQFSQYFKSWWKQLINWVFMPTVVFIILGAGTRFITPKSVTISESSLFSFEVLGGWVISVLLLYLAYKIPMKSMGGSVGNMISSTAKSFGTKVNETGGMAKDLGLRKLYDYGTDFDYKDNPDTGKKKFARFLAAGGVMTSQRYWKYAAEERKKLNEKNIQEFEKNATLTTPGIKQLAGDDAIRRQEIDRRMEIDEYKSEEQHRREMAEDKNADKYRAEAAEKGVSDEALGEQSLNGALDEIKGKKGMERSNKINEHLERINSNLLTNRSEENSLRDDIVKLKKANPNADISKQENRMKQLALERAQLVKQRSVLSGADAWLQENLAGSPAKFNKTARALGLSPKEAAKIRSGFINLSKKERSRYRGGTQSMFQLLMDPANYESGGRTAFFGEESDQGPSPTEKFKVKDKEYHVQAQERIKTLNMDNEVAITRTSIPKITDPKKTLEDLRANIAKLNSGETTDIEKVINETKDNLQKTGVFSSVGLEVNSPADLKRIAPTLQRLAEKRAKALEAILTAHTQSPANTPIHQVSEDAIQKALVHHEKENLLLTDLSKLIAQNANPEQLNAQIAQIAYSRKIEVSPERMGQLVERIKSLDAQDSAKIADTLNSGLEEIKQSASVQGSYNPNDQATSINEGTPFDPGQ